MIGEDLGPYRIERELGSGGMGQVYAATVTGRIPGVDRGTRVALKVIHPSLVQAAGFYERFSREVEIGKAVRHENVVRTFDCGVYQDRHFIAMEYVRGQTLRELLLDLDRVPEELSLHIGRLVAQGLDAIHAAGAVHRDLKPENVLITPEQVVKVMDLGVARLQDEAVRLSRTGVFVGSVQYAAPEQLGSGDDVDHRADLHALGVLLYELVSGICPYYDESLRVVFRKLLYEEPRRVGEINPQLSAFFEEVIHTLLAKDRDQRFDTAAELASVLEQGEESGWWRGRSTALREATRRPLRRIRIPRETALYGREHELAALNDAFVEAAGGEGRVVLLEGEAGIGKTRLVDEFVGGLLREGADLNFLYGSYPPGGAATAGGALSTAFREHLGLGGSAAYLEETPLLVPAFDAVLRGDAAPSDAEPLTQHSLGTCFVHVLQALARDRPTVLFLDDLHSAPVEALGLFMALALAIRGHPVLLVGTHRPGVPEEWLANCSLIDHTTLATLRRLGPKDLALLLEDTFHSVRLAQVLGHQIAVKSDGNPFFAFEIVRGLREEQRITQCEDGTWISTCQIEEIEIPSRVKDLIQARISDLSENERSLLDVASCLGFEFDPLRICDALDMERIPTLQRLGRIEKTHRIVRSSGRRFVFDHHQVHEALYESLSPLLREAYHAVLAEALERRTHALDRESRDLDGADCVALCEHYFRGARGDAALRYLDAALEYLEKSYLSAEAASLARRALDSPGLVGGEHRVDLLLMEASHLSLRGRPEDERRALDEALPLAEALAADGGDLAVESRALRGLGWHHYQAARYAEALEVLRRARACAVEAGDEMAEILAAGNLGSVLYALGRYEEARAHCERQLEVAKRTGNRHSEAGAEGDLGRVLHRLGSHEAARRHLDRSLEVARASGARRTETFAEAYLGAVARAEGRYEEAIAYHEKALAFARQTGDRRAEVADTTNLANVLTSLGRYDEARKHHERALALSQEIGDPRGEGIELHNLGTTWLHLGDPKHGCELLEQSRSLAESIGDRAGVAYSDWLLGEHAARGGEIEVGRRVLGAAVDRFRNLGIQSGLAGALVTLGALHAAEGEADAARAHFEEALTIARETGSAGPAVLAACHLAALRTGDSMDAELDSARAALQEHGPRSELHERMEANLLLWRAAGDAEALSEASRLLEETLVHTPAAQRAACRDHVPLHREVAAADA